jgi:hypothetical protein
MAVAKSCITITDCALPGGLIAHHGVALAAHPIQHADEKKPA